VVRLTLRARLATGVLLLLRQARLMLLQLLRREEDLNLLTVGAWLHAVGLAIWGEEDRCAAATAASTTSSAALTLGLAKPAGLRRAAAVGLSHRLGASALGTAVWVVALITPVVGAV
jgi:hypothetical protein